MEGGWYCVPPQEGGKKKQLTEYGATDAVLAARHWQRGKNEFLRVPRATLPARSGDGD